MEENLDSSKESSIEYKKAKIGLIYDYICDKQRSILFMIDWKLQSVQVMHFLDHFKSNISYHINVSIDRLLPEVSKAYGIEEKFQYVTPKRFLVSPSNQSNTNERVYFHWLTFLDWCYNRSR